MNLDDYEIVQTYGAEYRGIVQYYLLASDVWRLKRLRWAAETSMLKTLAARHQLDRDQDGRPIQGQHRHTARSAQVLPGQHRPRRKTALVARFGGIPLDGSETRYCTTPPQSRPTPARSWSPGS